MIQELTAAADDALAHLTKGQSNVFRKAAAAYEATDREVTFVAARSRDLDRDKLNSDGDPATFALGRTMDGRILINAALGRGDVIATATHEILVHGQERVFYMADRFPATNALDLVIWDQLSAALRPTAELWRRKTH